MKKRTVVDVPVGRGPVVETRYDSVVDQRRGLSGVVVAALVVAAITATAVVTMLILNTQERNSDGELAQERARTAAAMQTPAQPAQQQPGEVNMPPSQPTVAPSLYPAPGPSEPAPTYTRMMPSTASVEIEVTSLLQNDEELRPYAIFVKVTGGTATLSGYVPNEDLRKLARERTTAVIGVRRVINDIVIRP